MDKAILLLESEEKRRRRIIEIIDNTLEYVTVYTAKTSAEAYKILVERTIDIFIINVVLECENATDTAGLRFIAKIREIPKYTLAPVIIISSLKDTSMYACDKLNCLGYLRKAFSTEKMEELLRKAALFQTSRDSEGTLFFRKKRVLYPVLIKDIVFMQRDENITYIHLKDDTVMDIPYVTFKDIIYEADGNSLLMCNRSTIVNKSYVYAVDATNRFIMLKENRGTLDIGVKYRKQVLLDFLDCDGDYREALYQEKNADRTVFFIRKNNVFYRISVEDFAYAESFERILHIHLRNGEVLEVSQKPIQYIAGQIGENEFIRCGRGLLVNKNCIVGLNKDAQSVVLEDGTLLRIGKAYMNSVKENIKCREKELL